MAKQASVRIALLICAWTQSLGAARRKGKRKWKMARLLGVIAGMGWQPDFSAKGIENHNAPSRCALRVAIFRCHFSIFQFPLHRTRRARRKDVNANTSIVTA
jgi:hypothetical protein